MYSSNKEISIIPTWVDISVYAHMSMAFPAGYSALEMVNLVSSVGYMGCVV